MNADNADKMSEYQHFELTKEIIGTFYDVYNMLGYGFLEEVYENALAIELGIRGFQVEHQNRSPSIFAIK